jgi:hypothetical protein
MRILEKPDVIGRYEGEDGRRQWWSGGTWLHPGERVVLITAGEAVVELAPAVDPDDAGVPADPAPL